MLLHPGEVEARDWRVEELSSVIDLLRIASPGVAGRPRVIAVDGRGGAGKTVLVQRLQAVFPASGVVHTDDLAWHFASFEWGGLMRKEILAPLHRGNAVEFCPPAWIERDRPGTIQVRADLEFVWIEGTGIIRHELTEWIDASIWIQGDAQNQTRRLVVRDGDAPEHQREVARWLKEELPFLLLEQPWAHATLILNGDFSLVEDSVVQVGRVPAGGPLQGV